MARVKVNSFRDLVVGKPYHISIPSGVALDFGGCYVAFSTVSNIVTTLTPVDDTFGGTTGYFGDTWVTSMFFYNNKRYNFGQTSTTTFDCDVVISDLGFFNATLNYANNIANFFYIEEQKVLVPYLTSIADGYRASSGSSGLINPQLFPLMMQHYTKPVSSVSNNGDSGMAVINTVTGPTTSDLYLRPSFGDEGFWSTERVVKVSKPTQMTFPSSTSSSSSGTLAVTVTPSSSAQYVNVPTGYLSSSKYIKINSLSNATWSSNVTKSTTSTAVPIITSGGNVDSTRISGISLQSGENFNVSYSVATASFKSGKLDTLSNYSSTVTEIKNGATATITTLNNADNGAGTITTLNNGMDSGDGSTKYGTITVLNNKKDGKIVSLNNAGLISTLTNSGEITTLMGGGSISILSGTQTIATLGAPIGRLNVDELSYSADVAMGDVMIGTSSWQEYVNIYPTSSNARVVKVLNGTSTSSKYVTLSVDSNVILGTGYSASGGIGGATVNGKILGGYVSSSGEVYFQGPGKIYVGDTLVSNSGLVSSSWNTGSAGTTTIATITPSTSAQYVKCSTAGWTTTDKYVKINAMSSMTFPTSASTTSSGSSAFTVTPSTSTQYVNVPTGYLSSAKYVTVNKGMPIPYTTTIASVSGKKYMWVKVSAAGNIAMVTNYSANSSYYKAASVTANNALYLNTAYPAYNTGESTTIIYVATSDKVIPSGTTFNVAIHSSSSSAPSSWTSYTTTTTYHSMAIHLIRNASTSTTVDVSFVGLI